MFSALQCRQVLVAGIGRKGWILLVVFPMGKQRLEVALDNEKVFKFSVSELLMSLRMIEEFCISSVIVPRVRKRVEI